MYTGKSSGLYIPELGETGSVVVRLTNCVENRYLKIANKLFMGSDIGTLLTRSSNLFVRNNHANKTTVPKATNEKKERYAARTA